MRVFGFWLSLLMMKAYSYSISTHAKNSQATSIDLPAISDVHQAAAEFKRVPSYVQVKRQARIKYKCHFSGEQWKTFKWQARYDSLHIKLSVTGLLGIAQWDHITTVANDYKTQFHTTTLGNFQDLCCTYTFRAPVIGTIFSYSITSQVDAAARDADTKIMVTERCMMSLPGATCPVMVGLPSTECQILRVSQGRA